MTDEYEGLREKLRMISDEIADLAMSDIRNSIEEGQKKTSDIEKKLTRARRSIEKAIHLLEPETDEFM
ncbi:MAG: hypothetical protein VX843_06330 [Actinomycetota bacterium]|jgi:hypothetical protein|nr:hypothetical protein [Actinomycetota bacterium]MEE2646831.1 hypothetical protein [Actinomycetota bacterium]|tara:strand:- start:850 stop:1053 length:204 start_codon:yes stop_codon:yes gene_type:complete